MKIRLITFHTPKNYGAVFQAYSLMSVLKNKCNDVKIIDFNTPHLRSLYPIIPKCSNIKSFLCMVLNFYTYPFKYKKYKKFDAFICKYMDFTRRYENVKCLYGEKWSDDTVFVCGSDQVFNPNRVKDEQQAFYMDFVPDRNYKFSYAASFGISKIPDAKKKQIISYLEKFDAISVRENSGVSIVENLLDKNATEVIDPTLLNGIDFWEKCEKPYNKSFSRYLLYYRLLGTKESDSIAMKKAKEENLQLVVVTELMLRGLKCNKILRDVGPEELLWLYHHADYVVTDSFHGIAFSVIYEKPFTFSDMNPILSERGLNLIRQLGIKQESVYGRDANGIVDYNAVNVRLKELRKNADNFIDCSLKKAKEKELNYEN